MDNEKYDVLYDLVQCDERIEFIREFEKLTLEERKVFLLQFIVDFCECALQCKISKDSAAISAFANKIMSTGTSAESIASWLFGELEDPDLESYLNKIQGDTNE